MHRRDDAEMGKSCGGNDGSSVRCASALTALEWHCTRRVEEEWTRHASGKGAELAGGRGVRHRAKGRRRT